MVSIAGGWRHSVAVDTAGLLYAWGWNKVRSPSSRSRLPTKTHDCHDSQIGCTHSCLPGSQWGPWFSRSGLMVANVASATLYSGKYEGIAPTCLDRL